ncbi:MAG: trypsin-like peptidase domain-containing protein [Clostridia bacterium]|nr:trypsin-like peptidase domain-containing protein [Clostridia bacterium]
MDNYQDQNNNTFGPISNEKVEQQIKLEQEAEQGLEINEQQIKIKKDVSNGKKFRNSIVTIVIVALLSGFGGGAISTYFMTKNLEYNMGGAPNIEIIPKDAELNTASVIAEKVLPSVVGIATEVVYSDFFGKRIGEGVGTGVIVDEDGYILTNSHVVNNGDTSAIRVLLHDGREVEGTLLWHDQTLDLAIVKIDVQNLTPAVLGDSEELKVGELAVAIGNPLGFQFERTLTQGVISGLNRTIPISNYENIEGLIQTDASINPGNSGGPLLNQYGQVIGINTAKIQSGEGLGFAIPINIAQPIVSEFIEKGEFRKVYLGIRGVSVKEYLQTFNDDLGVEEGVFIYQIFTDSPVAKAKLREGDVIVKIGDKDIQTMTQLVNELYKYRPNDTVQISVVRDGKIQEVTIVFEAVPESFN